MIHEHRFPAQSPIEQRWSASSQAVLSPAHDSSGHPDTVFSWVGIIMYLPSDVQSERDAVTDAFFRYQRYAGRGGGGVRNVAAVHFSQLVAIQQIFGVKRHAESNRPVILTFFAHLSWYCVQANDGRGSWVWSSRALGED